MGTLALCAEHVLSGKPDLWFSEDPQDRKRAGDVCMDCPLKMTCPDRVGYNRSRPLPSLPKPPKPPKLPKLPKPPKVKPSKPPKVTPPSVRLCRVCGEEFPAQTNRRYCSDTCRAVVSRAYKIAWKRAHYVPTGRPPGHPRASLDDPCPRGHVGERYRDKADQIWCRACTRERWQRRKDRVNRP